MDTIIKNLNHTAEEINDILASVSTKVGESELVDVKNDLNNLSTYVHEQFKKKTTLAEYGIEDANISETTITLGENSIDVATSEGLAQAITDLTALIEEKADKSALAAAETKRTEAENIRKQNETARQSAESERIAKEQERKANEDERKAAETARAKAEASRQQAETVRGNAETNRADAETLRQQKESERQQAEQERIENNEKCVTATNSALSAAEKATTAANNATKNATTAAEEANAAADRANKAADLVYNGPDENVSVAIYTDVEGVSTAGLVLNVYINESTVPQQYTTDSNGLAAFKVTKGLRYDIVFPDIEGCAPIGRLSYTAALQTRGIEVTYHEAIVAAQEKVTISFMRFPENTTWNGGEAYPDGVARVTIDGVETVYNADSNGQVQFFVPIGKEYRVSIDKPADLHLITGAYSATYTADRAARVIPVSFHPYLSDILIVDKDGGEWTYDGFIASGKDVSEGVLLHIATEELLAVGCDFFMSVDVMAYRKFDTDKTEIKTMSWAAQSVQFTSIPLDGNDASQEYYYDGLTATNLIVQEGLSRGINTDCHTRTLRETYALGVTTLQGFTPSTGQYAPLIANYTYINDIITFLRPDGDVVNKFWGLNKGTSTQQSAAHAFYVSRYVSSTYKNIGYLFAPVCAYAKPTL